MTTDEQEAKSRWHTGFWIVPLSSGRFGAGAHPVKTLVGVFDTVEEAAKACQHVPKYEPRLSGRLNLEGIDL